MRRLVARGFIIILDRNPLFASVDMSEFNDGRVHFTNSGNRRLSTGTCFEALLTEAKAWYQRELPIQNRGTNTNAEVLLQAPK